MAKQKTPPPPNPARLTTQQLADLLGKAGRRPVTAEEVQAMQAQGLPQNADGTFHFVHVVAWLAEQVT